MSERKVLIHLILWLILIHLIVRKDILIHFNFQEDFWKNTNAIFVKYKNRNTYINILLFMYMYMFDNDMFCIQKC